MAKRPEPKDYFYIDINLRTMAHVERGETSRATHAGKTDDPEIHRVFLTKGQYSKLVAHLE